MPPTRGRRSRTPRPQHLALLLLIGACVQPQAPMEGQSGPGRPALNLHTARVEVPSSLDGSVQRCLLSVPEPFGPRPRPLLVLLHSWSADYRQEGFAEPSLQECTERGWLLLRPDFRGPNRRPEACASDLACQDILDAVAWVRERHAVDPRRIYLVGTSGGGHMSLQMAARAPGLWAGVSAWVPVSDLAAWHAQCLARPRFARYARDLEKICGGPPGRSSAVDRQYHFRSPRYRLQDAGRVPIDINAGIDDGHTGSVPITHSIWAFHALLEARGAARSKLDPALVTRLCGPERRSALRRPAPDPSYAKPLLFRRHAADCRLSLFDGGHEGDMPAAIAWLARQLRKS